MTTEIESVQIQIQTIQTFEEEKHCCGACRRSPHISGLICCVSVWVLLVCTIFYHKSMTVAPVIVMYVLYLIEALVTKTWRYVWNMKVPKGEDIGMYIQRMKNKPPCISMTCECFHYETRTRLVTEYYTEYINGQTVSKSRTRTEIYQVKVVSYNGHETFSYREWSDASGGLSDEILKYNAVRIDLSKSWVASNPETAEAFNLQYNNFKAKHRNRDTYFTSFQALDIDGFKPNVMWVVHQAWYMNWQTYAVFTIMSLSSVFYRYWLDHHSVKAYFEVKKTVTL